MTRRTPPPLPRFDLWPPAVRSAEQLRGTLVRCGPGLRGIGWPETPRVRAAALGAWLTPDRIAVRLTAAWVWGAARDAGRPLEFSTADRRRPERSGGDPAAVIHQFAYDAEELHLVDPGLRVTAPERTACDLLRDPSVFDLRHRVAVRLLVALVPGGAETVREQIATGRAQYRSVALDRLAAVYGHGA